VPIFTFSSTNDGPGRGREPLERSHEIESELGLTLLGRDWRSVAGRSFSPV